MGEDKDKGSVDPGTPVESLGRRGEDMSDGGKEAGRRDTDSGTVERPAGTSDARDFTGIDPKEPKGGGSPAG